MMRSLLFLMMLLLFSPVNSLAQEEDGASIMVARSQYDFDETYARLKDRLQETEGIQIFAEIDHAENARKAGLDLKPNRLIIFGNAKAGTPLMQQKQIAGLDLPLKMLIYENKSGEISLAYSDVDFLKNRYSLKDRKVLQKIKKNLKAITRDVTGRNPKRSSTYKVRYLEGIHSIKSELSFNESLSRLKSEIISKKGLELFSEIDHTKNAEELNLGLRPASLLIFGNVEVGSRLIQGSGITGLELPLKIFVWRDEKGVVQLTYNSVEFLAKRFKVSDKQREISKMQEVLSELSKKTVNPNSD